MWHIVPKCTSLSSTHAISLKLCALLPNWALNRTFCGSPRLGYKILAQTRPAAKCRLACTLGTTREIPRTSSPRLGETPRLSNQISSSNCIRCLRNAKTSSNCTRCLRNAKTSFAPSKWHFVPQCTSLSSTHAIAPKLCALLPNWALNRTFCGGPRLGYKILAQIRPAAKCRLACTLGTNFEFPRISSTRLGGGASPHKYSHRFVKFQKSLCIVLKITGFSV